MSISQWTARASISINQTRLPEGVMLVLIHPPWQNMLDRVFAVREKVNADPPRPWKHGVLPELDQGRISVLGVWSASRKSRKAISCASPWRYGAGSLRLWELFCVHQASRGRVYTLQTKNRSKAFAVAGGAFVLLCAQLAVC